MRWPQGVPRGVRHTGSAVFAKELTRHSGRKPRRDPTPNMRGRRKGVPERGAAACTPGSPRAWQLDTRRPCAFNGGGCPPGRFDWSGTHAASHAYACCALCSRVAVNRSSLSRCADARSQVAVVLALCSAKINANKEMRTRSCASTSGAVTSSTVTIASSSSGAAAAWASLAPRRLSSGDAAQVCRMATAIASAGAASAAADSPSTRVSPA